MSRTLTLRLAMLVAAASARSHPRRALEAQKALVYCPVGVDATGCNTIVAALAADATRFPDGVDAGYDGTSGTVDLAGGDLSGYAVFVVPVAGGRAGRAAVRAAAERDDRGPAAGGVHGPGGGVVGHAGRGVDQSSGEGQPDPEPGGMGEGGCGGDARAGGRGAAGQLG